MGMTFAFGTLPKRAGALLLLMIACLQADITDVSALAPQKQISFGGNGRILAPSNIWSPDSREIVYDERERGDVFNARAIEAVDVDTGKTRVLYRATEGSACGVASWNPKGPFVVFIQGPEPETPDWPYAFSRRRGVVVNTDTLESRPLEAANYAPPFAKGALRGGTHVHMFDRQGQWVSYTYDDEWLTRPHIPYTEAPRRTIAVSAPLRAVHVEPNHPRNHDGDYFSFIAADTTPAPRPGSDDVSRACEESWIGQNGYRRADGKWQRRALAFQGTVLAADGKTVFAEVFVADLPDDPTAEGDRPMGGDLRHMGATPKGFSQRRLTFTQDRPYPGLQGPRHYLLSSPDGEQIAFLMKDAVGTPQLFLISPRGGEPRALTHEPAGVVSNFTWSPDGRFLSCVIDNSVCLVEAATGRILRLTPKSDTRAIHVSPCAFSPDGTQIAFSRIVDGKKQIFTVAVPQGKAMLSDSAR